MTCTSPVYLYDYQMYVPCNKCTACKIAHSREWSVRLIHELDYHDKACFVTLTYDDEYLPPDGGISKRELQLFFKRLRKNGKDEEIKYFASGEYGEKNGRPHYHAIILGTDDKDLIEKCWTKGLVHVGSVTYDSCRYVCDYTFKKYTAKWNKEIYGDKEPPFQLQSQGIGLRYVEKNYKQIMDNLNITYKGENVGIPLYYKRKLVLSTEKKGALAREHIEELKEHYDVGESDDNELFIAAWRAALEQSSKNISAREALKGARKM